MVMHAVLKTCILKAYRAIKLWVGTIHQHQPVSKQLQNTALLFFPHPAHRFFIYGQPTATKLTDLK
jgi:hypothetical protein